jgi:hypothetical protein
MKTEEEYIFFHYPKKLFYESLVTPLKTSQTETLEYIISKNQNLSNTNPFSSNIIKSPILTNANEHNKTIRTTNYKKSVKLPLLINKNNISSFEKRKNYKIIIPEKIEKIENSKHITKKMDESNDKINIKKKNKKRYTNYFLKKSEIRRKRINELLEEINKTEDRFNKEIPMVDSNLVSKDKILVDNKWKNSFYLDEYQQFFMKNLKGKISSMNYRQMLKKFTDISKMCFSPGNEHNIPKKIKYLE